MKLKSGVKIIIGAIAIIMFMFFYIKFIYVILDERDNAPCNDIITLTDGTIINCKRFSVNNEVLSYYDCDGNKVMVPLVNIKRMKRIEDEEQDNNTSSTYTY